MSLKPDRVIYIIKYNRGVNMEIIVPCIKCGAESENTCFCKYIHDTKIKICMHHEIIHWAKDKCPMCTLKIPSVDYTETTGYVVKKGRQFKKLKAITIKELLNN